MMLKNPMSSGCAPWLPPRARRLFLRRAERVSQVVRRASKREKFDTPGHYLHASVVPA